MKFFKKKSTAEELIQLIGARIYTGPFAGLKIPPTASAQLTVSEILGLYESCLHDNLHTLLDFNIQKMIIVGGNNGYYPAGLFYFLNPGNLQVYEMLTEFHPQIMTWFDHNKLPQPEILGKATPAEFKTQTDIDFMFMDCEGFESELLDPEIFKWQKKTVIIFELHHFYIEKLLSSIASKFKDTHKIKLIYDNPQEDNMIEQILQGLCLDIKYHKHPTHRWIVEDKKKIYTSGIFLHLIPKYK